MVEQVLNLIGVYRPAASPPERMKALRLTGGSPYRYHTLILVEVPGVRAGDELHIDADFQVTTELPYVVMVACGVAIGEAEDGFRQPTRDRFILPRNGTNIGRSTHHYCRSRSGWWTADRDYERLYVGLCVYTASTAYKSGDALKVDTGYGSMAVAVYRKGGE